MKTLYNEHTYPNEKQDPHYTILSSFFNQVDLCIWNSKLRSNFILAGGGTIVWNSGTSNLSWTENFALKHLNTGFLVQFAYGPDGINREAGVENGQLIYGTFPSSLSESVTKNLLVADKLDKADNYFVLGWRYGDKIYFQNGLIL